MEQLLVSRRELEAVVARTQTSGLVGVGGLRPYYDAEGVTIFHGNCRDIVPLLSGFDLVLTDPPYPNYMEKEYGFHEGIINWLAEIQCRQFIFWTPSARFPLDWSGMRVWDKAVGTCTQFELLYERNYGSGYKVHRYMTPHNRVRAQICRDVCNEHPSQKPIQLLTCLIAETEAQVILDPYAGSGTTGLAAKNLNRRAILIEREERYCEIAANRLAQSVLPLGGGGAELGDENRGTKSAAQTANASDQRPAQ